MEMDQPLRSEIKGHEAEYADRLKPVAMPKARVRDQMDSTPSEFQEHDAVVLIRLTGVVKLL
jgi:hypothetical protein